MRKRRRTFLTLFLAVGSWIFYGSNAMAQQASTFDQLRIFSKPGDTISLKTNEGIWVDGKVIALNASSLRVESNGNIRSLAESEVVEVKQRLKDRVFNGALIGAAAGAGLVAASPLECRHGCGNLLPTVAFYSLAGAGIGAGIDGLIHAKRTVFMHGSAPGEPQASLSDAFEDARSALRFDERVQIIDKSGNRVTGRLASLTSTGFRLNTRGGQEWKESDIMEIRAEHRDSARDGALYGTLIGGALGGIAMKSECPTGCYFGEEILIVLGMTGGGAATGAIIDAVNKRLHTVFKVADTKSGARVSFSPVVSKDRKGLALSLRF